MSKKVLAALLFSALFLSGCAASVSQKDEESYLMPEDFLSESSKEENSESPTEPTIETPSESSEFSPSLSGGEKMTYETISQQEAKAIMDGNQPFIILDVREENEYNAGYIPGAILLPHEQVGEKAAALLPDKDALILVYCRSGRRSKIASEALANLGYSNVKEFGGIVDWDYEIVTP